MNTKQDQLLHFHFFRTICLVIVSICVAIGAFYWLSDPSTAQVTDHFIIFSIYCKSLLAFNSDKVDYSI